MEPGTPACGRFWDDADADAVVSCLKLLGAWRTLGVATYGVNQP